MEKLIELYNKHLQDRGLTHKCVEREVRENINMLDQLKLFVKWLIENDKIDKKKLDKVERKPMYVTDDMFSLYKVDECVIMLLSISDTPIEDLISYLK